MSAENWLRRASGLVVPTMGFADNLAGKMQACPSGDCCEIFDPDLCDDLHIGTEPKAVFGDFPDIGDDECDCSGMEQTVEWDWPDPIGCGDIVFAGPVTEPDCGEDAMLLQFTIRMRRYPSNAPPDPWQLVASIKISGGIWRGEHNLFWGVPITSSFSEFDFTLSFLGDLLTTGLPGPKPVIPLICDGTGTTVSIYE